MRVLAVGCLVLVVLGIAVWLRPGAGAGAARAGVTPAALPARAEVARPDPRNPDIASPSAHDAAAAIRARSANRSTPAHTPNTANAVAPRRDVAASERDARRGDAPDAATQEAPRPAGELFLPFIADDPNQVFAPATVNFHAAVQAEPVDAEWGPHATAALRDHITGLFGERFEIPYVDCRQDLCELQVAGRVGSDLHADMRDIQQALAGMHQMPWWAALQFDQETGTVGSAPDGRVIALWFFSRK